MASTPLPPLRYNFQDPQLTPDVTAVTSTTRSQVQPDSRFTPDAGATSKSPVCVEGSSDCNQRGTPSPSNDSYLDPLMQWHGKEQQVQFSRYVSCTSNLVLPLTRAVATLQTQQSTYMLRYHPCHPVTQREIHSTDCYPTHRRQHSHFPLRP